MSDQGKPQQKSQVIRGTMIGKSMRVKGELQGEEDLTIDGSVHGTVDVGNHNLAIARNGRVKVEAKAKSVLVNGQVTGDVKASDRIRVGAGGKIDGDLVAPAVMLSDGAIFEGTIECRDPEAAQSQTDEQESSQSQTTKQTQRVASPWQPPVNAQGEGSQQTTSQQTTSAFTGVQGGLNETMGGKEQKTTDQSKIESELLG